MQATAQLAALSQAVAESAIRGDYPAVQARLRIPIDQRNLRQVEYTAADGRALPVMQEYLIVGGSYYARLRIEPSSHAYEDFLWHLAPSRSLLGLAIALPGWLTHALLRINLKDLTRLSVPAARPNCGNPRAPSTT